MHGEGGYSRYLPSVYLISILTVVWQQIWDRKSSVRRIPATLRTGKITDQGLHKVLVLMSGETDGQGVGVLIGNGDDAG